jgi:hypothetical protein
MRSIFRVREGAFLAASSALASKRVPPKRLVQRRLPACLADGLTMWDA